MNGIRLTVTALSLMILGSSVAPASSAAGADMTCFAMRRHGVSCLTATGWVHFDRRTMKLRGPVRAIAGCSDGRIYAASSRRISVYDDNDWAEYAMPPTASIRKLVCRPGGGLWVAQHRAVSRFDGDSWQTYPAEDIVPAATTTSIKDLAAAKDGGVWVTMFGGYVARLRGDAWRVFREGEGFSRRLIVSAVAVDARDRPHVGASRRVMRFTEGRWRATKKPFGSVRAIVFDSKGGLWMGVSGKGIFRRDGGKWTSWSSQDGGPASDSIRAMAFDGRGRLWVGTSFGISVFDGSTWASFQMHNSNMPGNTVASIAVIGDGGELPQRVEKQPGSFTGTVEWRDGRAVSGRVVEVCGESAKLIFRRDSTPCTGRQLHAKTKTADDGSFTLNGLPPADYRMTVQTEGGWHLLALGRRGRLRAGQTVRLGTLKIRPKRR